MQPVRRVGWIGLGQMGSAMANTLLKAGVQLTVFDIAKDKLDTMGQLGAEKASSAAEVAADAGVEAVVTMLPSSDHVWETYAGKKGILAGTSSGSATTKCPLFVDCSTISPSSARSIAARIDALCNADEHRSVFIDAPVSGGVLAASQGTLTFLCGADAAALERARPLLLHMGKRIVHTGPVGTGQSAKLCNNLVLALSMAAVAEGLTLGAQLGLDPKLLSEVFNSSSARCWASELYNPVPGVLRNVPASNNYQGGFANRLMVKDLNLCLEAAADHDMNLPMCNTVQTLYKESLSENGQDRDFSSIYQWYAKLAQANVEDRSLKVDQQM